MARPRKEVNEALVLDLASIGCTNQEMALICKVSEDTLERRFAVTIKEGRAQARESIRRQQFKLALKGHPTMLVWLGKIYLGQSEEFNVNTAAIDRIVQLMRDCLDRLKSEGMAPNTVLPESEAKPQITTG